MCEISPAFAILSCNNVALPRCTQNFHVNLHSWPSLSSLFLSPFFPSSLSPSLWTDLFRLCLFSLSSLLQALFHLWPAPDRFCIHWFHSMIPSLINHWITMERLQTHHFPNFRNLDISYATMETISSTIFRGDLERPRCSWLWNFKIDPGYYLGIRAYFVFKHPLSQSICAMHPNWGMIFLVKVASNKKASCWIKSCTRQNSNQICIRINPALPHFGEHLDPQHLVALSNGMKMAILKAIAKDS